MIAKVTKAGSYRIDYTIGYGPTRLKPVCRRLFLNCYEIGKTYCDELIFELKSGYRNSELPLTDCSRRLGHADESAILKQLVTYSEMKGLQLTWQQLAAAVIPNSVAALNAYGWMNNFFELTGDVQPNSNEIHLEPQEVKSIYEEYFGFDEQSDYMYLSYPQFVQLWKHCFPYVKIREFKAVTGKCQPCALLSIARRKNRSNDLRDYVTRLHCLHRTAYMGERMEYAKRIMQASQARKGVSGFLSIHSDGMAQHHTKLPWLGNMHQHPNTLPQHIQGVLMHSRGQFLFRTFHNISNGVNLQIHTFLLTLEAIKAKEGGLPGSRLLQSCAFSSFHATCCRYNILTN
jgi:hypothetical protein